MPGPIDRPAESSARGRRLTWLVAFVGFFLAVGAWSVAAPYDGTPDEYDHILRAYGVATGQVVLTPEAAVRGAGAFVQAPRSLTVDRCWQFKSDVPASCAAPPGGDETIVTTATGAGRYFPPYYALVGGPLALWPDWTGVLLARLLSAALCAFLLANALTDALRWTRHRLLAVGVLVAATPMVLHMGGAVNPSGVELAAGVAFFAAAIPLLFTPDARRNSTLLWHVGVAALALATLRMAGPLWLFLGTLALLLPLRWSELRDLWGWRALRWWLLGVGAAGVASVVWTVTQKTAALGGFFVANQDWSYTQNGYIEAQRWRMYLDEMVGVTSWLDTRQPEFVYVIWQSVAAAAVLGGFVLAHRAGKLRMAALVVAGIGVPYLMAVYYAKEVGFITQGRYLLPLLVGLPLLGVYLIQEHGVSAERSRSIARMAVFVLLPLHVIVLGITMVRWQTGLSWPPGLRNLNPFVGAWHPPLGTVTPLLALVLGLIVIGGLVWFGGLPRSLQSRGATEIPASRRPSAVTLVAAESGAGPGQGLE